MLYGILQSFTEVSAVKIAFARIQKLAKLTKVRGQGALCETMTTISKQLGACFDSES